MQWKKINTKEYINLELTLTSAQIFSFIKNGTVFQGTLDNHNFYFKQEEKDVLYHTDHPNAENIIENFFTLDINYEDLIKEWNHPLIKYNGLRLLRIDPLECIISFVCSQNNNVKRITKMVWYLKNKSNKFKNLNFTEEELKTQKFGYRSKYIIQAISQIKENWDVLFNEEKENTPDDYKEKIQNVLLSFYGVGRKVCDCILLLGYSFFDTVPVDVHMFRVSNKIFNLNYDKLTYKTYEEIVELFRKRFGKYCGIAQLYLFKASLDKAL